MGKKETTFKDGDHVTACPHALKDVKKAGKLMNRTGLTVEELNTPMQVIQTTAEGQLKLRHGKLKQPFVVHPKFMTAAQAQAS